MHDDVRERLARVEGQMDVVLRLVTARCGGGADQLDILIRKVDDMSADLDRIEQSVTDLKTVEDSAVKLLGDLSTLIRAGANDPARMKKLADDLDAQKADLSAAVAANTPAENPPPTTP